MRNWTPQSLYDLKPWVFVVAGAFFGVGTLLWSLWARLAVGGGADLP